MIIPIFSWPDLCYWSKRDAIDYYAENGFALFDKVMSKEGCLEIEYTYRLKADDDFAPILNLDRREPFIREVVMKNPVVTAIIERLTGSEMVGCQTFFLFKEPGTRYANQQWNPHQDNSYPRAEPGAYLAVDIALEDQEPNGGILTLWPGTHKLGLLPFEEKTGYREKEGERPGNKVIMPDKIILEESVRPNPDVERCDDLDELLKDAEVSFESIPMVNIALKQGQALVFDGNLIHSSGPNTSGKGRPAIITNYLKKGAEMIEGRTAQRMRIALR